MSFKIALLQFAVCGDKQKNIEKMEQQFNEATRNCPDFICFPEMWNTPYTHKYFREFAENSEGMTVKKMSTLAKENNVYVIGGSIPEIEDDKIYNTCFVFNRSGELIAKHRKVHLFDVDIKGAHGHRFFESETLSAGSDLTVFDTEFGKIGVAICYDLRFQKMFYDMGHMGAKLIFLPAAFNMTTGPAHWEKLIVARGLDNQIFFAANGQGRDIGSPFIAYGHSMVSTPYGDITARLDHREGILFADIDFDELEKVREQLPILK